MEKEKRPTKDYYDKFDMGNTSSATECTGLITHMPTDEDLEAYQQIFDYQASPAVSENDLKDIRNGKNVF